MPCETKSTFFYLFYVWDSFFFACKKTENNNALISLNKASASTSEQVIAAKLFFEQNITTNSTQKFKKQPLWDQARIFHLADGDRIEVKLQFDRKYTFKTSFSGNNRFLLEAQSQLVIYKDTLNHFRAIIETRYPDLDYLNGIRQEFSGFVCSSTWNDQIINKRHFIDGKLETGNVKNNQINSQQSKMKLNSIDNPSECSLWADYYWCDNGWNNLGDCTYMYSICMDQTGGGGTASGDEMSRTAMKGFYVDPKIPGNDTTMVRGAAELHGAYNQFTEVIWRGSVAIHLDPAWTYSEISSTAMYSNSPSPVATTGFKGKITGNNGADYSLGANKQYSYAQAFNP